jgi:carboxyl-terminal processing protease
VKRLVPFLIAASLVATTAHVPAATATSTLSTLDREELATGYTHLTEDFYKKVDSQRALDGVRTGLVSYLEKNGIAKPDVPAIHASDDELANVRELDHEVQSVANSYGTRFGTKAITHEALAGLMGSVKDKYTVFLDEKAYAELNSGLDGTSFGGVGITYYFSDTSHELVADTVIDGGPADKAGIKSGDVITAIEGKPTNKLDPKDAKAVSSLLRGTPGTVVHLSVERAGTALAAPIAVTRAEIHEPSVISKILPGTDIGWIRLSVFGPNTGTELTNEIARLDTKGAKAYVLDLRFNGGGYLNTAVAVSSKFIPSGPIVSVESRGGESTQIDAEDTAIAPRPLAVLVNELTASASEITAGAIQDSGVGTIIGHKTYGKGVVQTIFPLPDKTAIKITTQRYLTARGHDINGKGIEPDMVVDSTTVPQGLRLGDPAHDAQLEKAVTFLDGKIARLDGTSAANPAAVTSTGAAATPPQTSAMPSFASPAEPAPAASAPGKPRV